VRRSCGRVTEVNYVDPTGQPIHDTTRRILEGELRSRVTDYRIQLQHGHIVEESKDISSWDGNSNDCGPLTIHMLQRLSEGPDEGIALLREE